jgi:rhodanese-related sulfurtransferase
MTRFVDAATLKAWLHDGEEIALFDVREHGQYGQSHLFYGIPLPYSRLELDAPRLAPRRGCARGGL